MKLPIITYVIFLSYFVAMIGLGLLAHKKVKKSINFSEEYWVGGRSFGPWLVAFTWATSWTSGGSFIGTPAVYYTNGWSALLWQAGAGVLGIIGIIAIGRRVSSIAAKSNCMTLSDLFIARFENKAMGFLTALVIIIFGIAYMISQYVAAARIFEVMTGIPYVIGIIIFAVLVGLYTSMGGLRGVAYTNVFQGLLMVFGTISIAVIMIREGGGLASITKTLAAQDPNLIVAPGPNNFLPFNTAISMFFVLGVAVIAQPHVVTRLFTVRNTDTIRRSGAMVAVITFIWFICLFVSSMAGRALIPEMAVPDQIFPTIVINYSSSLMAGLLLSAPFAAVMSTVASLLLSTSSAIIRDILERSSKEKISDDKLKKYSIMSTIGLSILVMVLAFNPPAFLQAIVIFALSGFAASFSVPIIVGLFWSGASPVGGLASMLSGFLVYIGLYLFKIPNPLGFHPLMWGLLVSLISIIVVSKMTKPSSDDVLINYFGIDRKSDIKA